MENIFENAYFGKPYKTRSGRKAIYIYYGTDVIAPFIERHHLIYEGLNSIEPSNYEEIVSEWQEEINEDELDKLAESKAFEFENGEVTDISYRDFMLGYKIGYRKAKEE